MIGGKGIRRFHPPGLAQFQPHAKDCATLALIPNFEPIGCRSLAARSAPCSHRSLGTSLSLTRGLAGRAAYLAFLLEISLFSLHENKWRSWRRAAPSKPKTKTRNNDNMLVVVWGLALWRVSGEDWEG